MKTTYILPLLILSTLSMASAKDDQVLSDGQIRHLQEKKEHAENAATTQQHLKSGREAILVELRCLRELEKCLKKVNDERTASFEEDTVAVAMDVFLKSHAALLEQLSKLDEHSQERLLHMQKEQLEKPFAQVAELVKELIAKDAYQRDKLSAALARFPLDAQ